MYICNAGQNCPFPPHPDHGTWICKKLDAPLEFPVSEMAPWGCESETERLSKLQLAKSKSFIVPFCISAIQCRLECDPGYISDLNPLFECTDGNYEPSTPNMFSCEPAVALAVSDIGEREILSAEGSNQCDQQLRPFNKKKMIGHSINLLDNQLILGATVVANTSEWWFMSLKNPRAGLLTNR